MSETRSMTVGILGHPNSAASLTSSLPPPPPPHLTGQTGLGKSTLINTIFASHLIDTKGRLEADEPIRQTTEIQAVSHSASKPSLLLPQCPLALRAQLEKVRPLSDRP